MPHVSSILLMTLPPIRPPTAETKRAAPQSGSRPPMMVQSQSNPSLTQRNWNRNRIKKSKPMPWYPIVVLVLVFQIGAVLVMNKDDAKPPTSRSPGGRLTRNRFGSTSHLESSPALLQHELEDTRPDSHLPANVKLRSLEEQIRQKYGVEHVKACRWHRKNDLGKMRIVPNDDCEGRGGDLVFYNPLDHDRRVCNNIVIPAGGFSRIDCDELRWRLFPTTPTLQDANEMPAVYVGMQVDVEDWKETREEGEYFHCDVPCQKNVQHALVADYFIGDTNWKIRYSMESQGYYRMIEFNQLAHRRNLFYATTSFDSEIPLPYFNWDEMSIQTPAVDFDNVIKGASFIAGNCESFNGREKVVQDLMKKFRVDSLGDCLNNAKPPPGSDLDDRASMTKQYLFHLAFENTNEKDYVTEKLWSTLESGTLPVYLGALNIREHAPPNSIIHVHDFDSGQDLGKYLLQVSKNKTLYESYHEWRKQPLPNWFHDKYDFTHTHSICRICRWAHARMYGYAFDHATQTIRDPVTPRTVCLDPTTRLLTRPFGERWIRSGGEVLLESPAGGADEGTCQSRGLDETVQVGTWKRTVSNRDGVIDIRIEGTGEDGVYQLGIPFTDHEVHARGPRQWVIQDSKSRITMLTSWDAIMRPQDVSEGNMIGIEVRGQKKMMLRLIVEEMEHFYEDGDRSSTYFGNLMANDFTKPMERFLVMDA